MAMMSRSSVRGAFSTERTGRAAPRPLQLTLLDKYLLLSYALIISVAVQSVALYTLAPASRWPALNLISAAAFETTWVLLHATISHRAVSGAFCTPWDRM